MSCHPDSRYLLLLAALVLAPLAVDAAEGFYKCTGANGRTAYQPTPCTSAEKQETVDVQTQHSSPPSTDSEPAPHLFGPDAYIPNKDEPVVTNRFVFQAKLSSVLAMLQPVKISLIDFYASNGKWPTTLQDIGFKQKNMNSSQIEQVSLAGRGALLVRLNKDFGDDKKIVLVPKPVMDGTSMEWLCRANFPEEALKMSGTMICESRVIF